MVRLLKDQLRQGFNISVAEMDEAVTWQSATVGVVAISRSREYLHGLIEEVERAARRMANELGAELADSFWEYLEKLETSASLQCAPRQRPQILHLHADDTQVRSADVLQGVRPQRR